MKKILIVDDMVVNREMTAFMLAGEYETFCAQSAKEATEIYRREKPDLVLSNFKLPDMTGCELQNELQTEFHKKIPFVFMTADKSSDEVKAFDNGAMDVISKPINPDVLIRRVANILRTVDEIQAVGNKEVAS